MKNEKKPAKSNAEMVTISRAEYESQQAQLSELKLQNQWLLEQLGLAKRREFGSSSERIQEDLMDQLGLNFNEAEAYAYGTKTATPEQIAVKAHERKRKSGSVTDIVPEGTPTEVIEHRLSDEERLCTSCGAMMEEIGKEVHRSLQMEPAKFWIREDVYYTISLTASSKWHFLMIQFRKIPCYGLLVPSPERMNTSKKRARRPILSSNSATFSNAWIMSL